MTLTEQKSSFATAMAAGRLILTLVPAELLDSLSKHRICPLKWALLYSCKANPMLWILSPLCDMSACLGSG